MERNKVGGTCAALIRRSIFESGFANSADLTSTRIGCSTLSCITPATTAP
jgi:hypothetical protein